MKSHDSISFTWFHRLNNGWGTCGPSIGPSRAHQVPGLVDTAIQAQRYADEQQMAGFLIGDPLVN